MFTLLSLRSLRFRGILALAFLCSAPTLFAQSGVISSDSLTPFQPRDVGALSEVKIARVLLNHPLAVRSVAIAPGFTDFIVGAVSGCAANGVTINPAFSVCEVPVTFAPKSPGLRTAPLVVTDSTGKKYSIGLQGTGLAPQAALTPGMTRFFATALTGTLFMNSIRFDSAGNLYYIDSSRRIRSMDPLGNISTVYQAADPSTIGPWDLLFNSRGEMFFSVNCKVKKLDLNGQITTIAGTDTCGFSGDGGPATRAQLKQRAVLALDSHDNLYIGDFFNVRVRKVDANGIIRTIAGHGSGTGSCAHTGAAVNAQLQFISGIALDSADNLYIVDNRNQRICKVDAQGTIALVAGNGSTGTGGDGGPARAAQLNFPTQIRVDAGGNLYFNDNEDKDIRRIDTHGAITRVAGRLQPPAPGTPNGDGGPATQAAFVGPALGLDPAGNLYFFDEQHAQLGKVDVSQSVDLPFAAHTTGTTSPAHRAILTNTGNLHLSVGAPTPFGAFDLLDDANPSYCANHAGLGLGESCAFAITFNPSDVGLNAGAVSFSTNTRNHPGTTHFIFLSGTGVPPR